MNNKAPNFSKLFTSSAMIIEAVDWGRFNTLYTCLDRWEEHVPHMQARLCKNVRRSRSVVIVLGPEKNI